MQTTALFHDIIMEVARLDPMLGDAAKAPVLLQAPSLARMGVSTLARMGFQRLW